MTDGGTLANETSDQTGATTESECGTHDGGAPNLGMTANEASARDKEGPPGDTVPPGATTAGMARDPPQALFTGLDPPRLEATGERVTGAGTPRHRIENKRRRRDLLARQPQATQWTAYKGDYELPDPVAPLETHRGEMCPSGLALHHPVANIPKEWATYGCPTRTGKPWTRDEMQAAIERGPHRSAMSDEAIAHFKAEVEEKVRIGQAKLVAWHTIKDDPPPELKISPIAAIPHKSKQFRSILVLSFHLRLARGQIIPSVNSTTVKMALKGAIDQLGHSLSRVIHAFAETEDDAKICNS